MLSNVDTGWHDQAAPWLPGSACYRVDVRAFRDADGDGCGDLDGLREQLDYLRMLGIDMIWLSGFLDTPLGGAGQGRDVDRVLGSVEAFEKLVAEAHAVGIRVTIVAPTESSVLHAPAATDEFARALRFWLDRGVDGFRVGITPGMTFPARDQVGQLARLARTVTEEYPERILGTLVDEGSPGIPGMDGLDMATDVRLCGVPFDADEIHRTIDGVLAGFDPTRIQPSWAIAGWNQPRPVTRYGGGAGGLARARALALVQMALPGILFMDNGDELGLPEFDHAGRVAGASDRGVMPWTGTNPTFGFTEAVHLAPPSPEGWAGLTVERQLDDPASTLSMYRKGLDLRRAHPTTGLAVEWFGAPHGCLAFRRDGTALMCALNTTPLPVPLPAGEVVLASGPLPGDELPAHSCVWVV